MPECCKTAPKTTTPPACCMQKNNDPTNTNWNPDAESSLLEDEQFPEMSLVSDSEDENSKRKRVCGEYSDISPITSERNIEQSKNVCNKTATLQKAQGKEKDLTMIYGPLPPPRGTYGHSDSFAQSNVSHTEPSSRYFGETFDAPRDHIDLGPWKNFNIPSNIQPRYVQTGAHKSFPRTHVPRPSRNYSTYEDSQAILNVKEVADYRKKLPRHFSTPKSPGYVPWQGTDESSIWGQDLSSFDPTNSSSWPEDVRMDSFNVIKHMTPSTKNVKVPPRFVQSYGANQSRVSNPTRTYTSQPPLAEPQYPYMAQTFAVGPNMGHSFAAGQDRKRETFVQRPASPNITRIHQPHSSSFTGQPSSKPLQSSFVQRPQSAQAYPTFHSPKLAQDIYSSRLNATMGGHTQRPQTANAIMESHSFHPPNRNAFGQSEWYGQRPRACSAVCKSNTQTPNRPALPAGQKLAPLSEFQNLDQNYDTILEIRAPRIKGGNQSSYPFQLSINVTCAEKSLLVTPQQRYTMLENTSVGPGTGKNYNSCCRCP